MDQPQLHSDKYVDTQPLLEWEKPVIITFSHSRACVSSTPFREVKLLLETGHVKKMVHDFKAVVFGLCSSKHEWWEMYFASILLA